MTLKIKDKEESEDTIELQRGNLWIDVLINDHLVATFFADGDATLCDVKTGKWTRGRWKK